MQVAVERVTQTDQRLQIDIAGLPGIEAVNEVLGYAGACGQAARGKPLPGGSLLSAQQDSDTPGSGNFAHLEHLF